MPIPCPNPPPFMINVSPDLFIVKNALGRSLLLLTFVPSCFIIVYPFPPRARRILFSVETLTLPLSPTASIVNTTPLKGEVVKKGDTITLFIPDVEVLYPDFTTYTVEQVEEYASKYGLILEKKYTENSLVSPNTIVGQSRKQGDPVVAGVTLTITITKTPDIVEDITLPNEE